MRPPGVWCGATTVQEAGHGVHHGGRGGAAGAEGGTRDPVGPPRRADRPGIHIYFVLMINYSMIIFYKIWHVSKDSNLHPPVLETGTLPVELATQDLQALVVTLQADGTNTPQSSQEFWHDHLWTNDISKIWLCRP